MRVLATVMVLALVVGCSSQPSPTPSPTVWGDRVPEAAPEAVAAQPVLARGPGTITLLPISPTGAQLGTAYGYDMPHCGINSPIDVDGSFWDAVGVPPDSVDVDGAPGIFRLVTRTEATFTASTGTILHLVRHRGAKAFPGCL